MKTNVYLVRHAKSIYTTDEINRPLQNKGYIDAKEITKILQNENIDYVICSPYKRAIQTVEGIAHIINKDIIIYDGFKERMLSKSAIKDFQSAVLKSWEDFNFSLDGGECNNAAQQRGVQALKEVLTKFEGKNIVIGTHGNIMVLIMNYYDKKYNYEFWSKLDMPDIYKLTFENDELINAEKLWNKK